MVIMPVEHVVPGDVQVVMGGLVVPPVGVKGVVQIVEWQADVVVSTVGQPVLWPLLHEVVLVIPVEQVVIGEVHVPGGDVVPPVGVNG